MEQKDIELIEELRSADSELNTLWEQHLLFEKQLEKLEAKPYPGPNEEVEIKAIKKKKLAGKTKIALILDRHRAGGNK